MHDDAIYLVSYEQIHLVIGPAPVRSGGDTFDGEDKSGRGGTSYTSGRYRSVNAASYIGPGQVHIIPAFKVSTRGLQEASENDAM